MSLSMRTIKMLKSLFEDSKCISFARNPNPCYHLISVKKLRSGDRRL
jgi:hypothetical protein